MDKGWSNDVERIAFATLKRGIRTLGVTSPQPASGVSMFCRELAELMALSGTRPLLIDFTRTAETEPPEGTWVPGKSCARSAVVTTAQGYDEMIARFCPADRFLFGNSDLLRPAMKDELADYDSIIVDLPPVPTLDVSRINGAAAAAACDATLLVCMSSRVFRAEAVEARNALANAQATIAGVLLNDFHNPTLGDELARMARKLRRYTPGVSKWLERKALANSFLN